MITPLGLEDQLLGIVAAKEKPELEEKKNELILESAANKKQVRQLALKCVQFFLRVFWRNIDLCYSTPDRISCRQKVVALQSKQN